MCHSTHIFVLYCHASSFDTALLFTHIRTHLSGDERAYKHTYLGYVTVS